MLRFQSLILCVLICGMQSIIAIAQLPSHKGIAFDGESGYVVSDFRLPSQTFSVAARVRFSDVSTSQMIVTMGTSATNFSLYLYQAKIRMLVEHASKNNGGAYLFAVSEAPAAEQWIHYTGTYDGKTISLYENGHLVGTQKAVLDRADFNAPLYLGVGPESGRALNGRLSDIRLWNRVLTPQEVSRVAQGESLNKGLVGAWSVSGRRDKTLLGDEERFPAAITYAPAALQQPHSELLNQKDSGYRSIWYHNQPSGDEYVYKYSGGCGTYPSNHIPFAVYVPQVNKTFFCYGGTEQDTEKTLLHEVAYFDHRTGMVPRPTILLDKRTTDAHDNPVMNVDEAGYIWIFSTSHGTGRPSFIHRSCEPYNVERFERVEATKLQGDKRVPLDNFSYFQVYHFGSQGFAALFTTYNNSVLGKSNPLAQRILCSMSSLDGVEWSAWQPYAGILHGHYQSSGTFNREKLGTAFNFHPNDRDSGRVGLNWRSNLYYMETPDMGKTWRNVRGDVLDVPLLDVNNPALVHDYFSEKLNVYIMDVNFDSAGRPIIVYLTSKGYESGPKNDLRRWYTAYWTGSNWQRNPIADSDNNYDFGALYVEADNKWRLIGTTEQGPQPWNTGGEVAMWLSEDRGITWKKVRQMTSGSEFNHSYPRRPVNAHPDFYAFWASGHGRQKSPSTLYFCNKNGDVFELPRQCVSDMQRPSKKTFSDK